MHQRKPPDFISIICHKTLLKLQLIFTKPNPGFKLSYGSKKVSHGTKHQCKLPDFIHFNFP